jgi:hypothetical protein
MSYDFAPPPSPYLHFPVSELDRLHIGRMRKRDNLPTGEGGGVGAKSYESDKARSSTNHLILSVICMLCSKEYQRSLLTGEGGG